MHRGYLFLIVTFFFISGANFGFASGPYLETVSVDTASFENNKWETFEFIIDVDTDSYDNCHWVYADYRIFSLKGGLSLWKFPYKWEVCGPDFHPNHQHFTHNSEALEGHEGGIFSCSGVSLNGHTLIDSFDSSLGSYSENSTHNEANIFCNAHVSLKGHSTVDGNVFADSVNEQGNSHITGISEMAERGWDCFKDSMFQVVDVVSTTNDNGLFGTTSEGNPPFFPEDSINLFLSNDDILIVQEGVYYLTSIHMTGQARVEISGPVTIFCNGPIDISGNAQINPDGETKDFALYSVYDDICLDSNIIVFGELFALR